MHKKGRQQVGKTYYFYGETLGDNILVVKKGTDNKIYKKWYKEALLREYAYGPIEELKQFVEYIITSFVQQFGTVLTIPRPKEMINRMNTQAKNERSVATVVRQKKQDDEFEEQIRKATETAIKNMRTAKVKGVNALAMKVNEMIGSDGKIKEGHSSAELAGLVKNMKEELSETTDVLSVTQSTLKDRLLSLGII